jgi:hypothetical protein
MNRALGLALLIVGAVLLYYGWQSHDVPVSELTGAPAQASGSKSIWLLGTGAVAAVWGLYALLVRPSP